MMCFFSPTGPISFNDVFTINLLSHLKQEKRKILSAIPTDQYKLIITSAGSYLYYADKDLKRSETLGRLVYNVVYTGNINQHGLHLTLSHGQKD